MNDDYLWDRTGEPDPETQRLEELLGTLRYEPRPLVIPEAATARQRRSFVPALAIAATIVLAVLALGVWLAIHRKAATLPNEAKAQPAQPKVNDQPTAAVSPSPKERLTPPRNNLVARSPHAGHRSTLARGPHRRLSPAVTSSEMSATEMAVAKDQLMLALRVASAKLNVAQRHTQNATPPPTPVRNQHRIG